MQDSLTVDGEFLGQDDTSETWEIPSSRCTEVFSLIRCWELKEGLNCEFCFLISFCHATVSEVFDMENICFKCFAKGLSWTEVLLYSQIFFGEGKNLAEDRHYLNLSIPSAKKDGPSSPTFLWMQKGSIVLEQAFSTLELCVTIDLNNNLWLKLINCVQLAMQLAPSIAVPCLNRLSNASSQLEKQTCLCIANNSKPNLLPIVVLNLHWNLAHNSIDLLPDLLNCKSNCC
jgi:hypothetical protein